MKSRMNRSSMPGAATLSINVIGYFTVSLDNLIKDEQSNTSSKAHENVKKGGKR